LFVRGPTNVLRPYERTKRTFRFLKILLIFVFTRNDHHSFCFPFRTIDFANYSITVPTTAIRKKNTTTRRPHLGITCIRYVTNIYVFLSLLCDDAVNYALTYCSPTNCNIHATGNSRAKFGARLFLITKFGLIALAPFRLIVSRLL